MHLNMRVYMRIDNVHDNYRIKQIHR